MDLSYLEQLIKIFESSTLTELEIDEEGSRVTLGRAKEPASTMFAMPPMGSPMMGYQMPQQQVSSGATTEPLAPAAPTAKTHEVKSPIVGTFYRAPAPDADSYVQVGQHVDTGTTLCIVEAMKLMNEIESDAAGKVIKILVENGSPVEYGQPLFVLEVE
ncbi:MAG: acetyl-CoA carboxylase biotin carboxyl carrier protein [Bacteroidota bacterium]|nr:acetyl-CoA carboxylase biotin carboxyl carrier protein [Bacteroidota bacterium]MDP4232358.1 acetyl-CoA carboxylase biotin carboxyl carrier protein [Bacteroidota bacterium]MDP4241495.1 acetyl-CoA carboxylase biotin carboxyl carrier protein [Bacteroidota bacterium]MDP4289007.1 acetyl-CoA carboxylase biotin carboxyl carrier protein [Bacteroidota bacterium]